MLEMSHMKGFTQLINIFIYWYNSKSHMYSGVHVLVAFKLLKGLLHTSQTVLYKVGRNQCVFCCIAANTTKPLSNYIHYTCMT